MEGDTETVLPGMLPGFHVYVVAPDTVMVAIPPVQNDVSAEATIGGAEVTCTSTESTAVHPNELVAVTVYVVVTIGVAVGFAVVAPVSEPEGCQL